MSDQGADDRVPRIYLAKGFAIVAIAVATAIAIGCVAAGAPVLLIVLLVPCIAIMVVRHADPRPQAVVTDDGVSSGGLLKSNVLKDVYVPWSEVRQVQPIEDGVIEFKVGRLRYVPESWTRWQRRRAPKWFGIESRKGRVYRIYTPGRGLQLDDVREAVISRWKAATGA